MKIETSLAPRHATLRLGGDFETYAIGDFLDAVREAREAGRNTLVLNMRKVKFLNSTAIGAILRARKECKAAGGGLAIANPSAFVRETFSKLGLATVVPHYDDEEEAAVALRAQAKKEALEAVEADEDSALLFRFYDQERADLLGRRGVGAGEIALLDLEGITFFWSGRGHTLERKKLETLFATGTELEVKFRLPLYSRSTYYLSPAKVTNLDFAEDGIRVRAEFTGLDDEAAQAVRQYVADMAMVREEIEAAQRDG